MKHPKLKYARLCRILTYVVVIGTGLLPIFIVFQFPVPDLVKVLVVFASLIGLLVYLVRNFMVLMMMDMYLAMLSCERTARTQYHLPNHRTTDAIRKSILRYGTECAPVAIKPTPSALRYKFGYPMTVYSRGIEKVIAAYEVDLLTKEFYREIFGSAKTNSKALIGKKKAHFLDKNQKKAPLNRVTVILILANKVDPDMKNNLYELVCKQCGDENEDCLVPCVVDLEQRTCAFNCLRVPFVGFGYAVKNRGIRIVKNRVFGGILPLTNNHLIQSTQKEEFGLEFSLWDLWKELHRQMVGAERETKRRFEGMDQREIQMCGDVLYLKWDQRGICQVVELETENMIAKVEDVTDWTYPKAQPIGKSIIQQMKKHIEGYFASKGYRVEYINFIDVETE